MAEWVTEIHDAMTGDFIERAFPAGANWSTSLMGDGTGTFTFQVDDEETKVSRSRFWELFEPNSRFIVHRWGDFIAYAGKIEDWDYSLDAKSITIPTVELANEFNWRLTYGVNQYENGTLTVTNRTHSGAVRAILARFMQWSAEWAYPIDLPADASGTFTQTWEYWRKYKIRDLIAQIEAEGYEVYLRPYRTSAGGHRFQTRVAQKVTIGTSSFFLQAAESPLTGVTFRRSGAQQITGGQGLGNGMGQTQPVAWAGSVTGQPIPIRDAKREFPGLEGDRLQASVNAWVQRDREPITQWSVESFQISDEWGPEHAAPGRVWQLHSKGDPIAPDGVSAQRVIKVSGGTGLTLKTEVQSAS
jgi:hypothetical protein